MRSTRWLLLVAIIAIVAAVGSKYYHQKRIQASQAPQIPGALPLQFNAAANDWVYSYTNGSHPIIEVRAKNFKQLNDPQRTLLEDVELHIFNRDGKRYDKVQCAGAEFDPAKKTLYADGDVEITMGVPDDGAPPGRLVFIRSSGVTFDSNSGKAATDRLASFTFDRGDGQAVGAFYDPDTRELHMHSQVELHWKGDDPATKVMKVQAGELVYKERESHVFLSPWSRLTRENMVLDAGDAAITLFQGNIKAVVAQHPHGMDRDPGRDLEYSAQTLFMDLTPKAEIEKLVGDKDARLVSTSRDTRTTVTCDRLDLLFDTASGDSTLKSALASGHSMAQSEPTLLEGPSVPQTRILRSDNLIMQMRPGGREIATVETHTPGYLEFLPNRQGQPYRRMDGTEMWITYGAENRIQGFRSVNVATRTEAEKKPGQKTPVVSRTWSKTLTAEFDPKTSQLARMEQTGDFRYEEGDRKARAARTILDNPKNTIWLHEGARIWDATGVTAADTIVMDQKNGDVEAKGHVTSTRLPDRKGPPSAMLSQDEPMQATAARMTSANHNQKVHYEGDAFVWQGANQVRASVIDIDREKKRMEADVKVSTQFVDKPKEDQAAPAKGAKPKSKAAPVFTVVTAQHLVYTDQDRVALYTGGAHLVRPGMDVKGAQIRAILTDDKNADSRLEQAFADGQVEILRNDPGRNRKGTAEHAQYDVSEDKIVLFGGKPLFQDSVRGLTTGARLTYFSDDDRLLVNGEPSAPSVSRIQRRK
jgi:lipopolysaccharide export system protein LptA